MAWSEKPPGQDYVQPSVTHFSLGKTKPFKGDANQPGVLKAMLEVRYVTDQVNHGLVHANEQGRASWSNILDTCMV